MFTHKFIKQISKIEHERQELAAYAGEDRRQGIRLNFMEERLIKMVDILSTIEGTPPNLKAKATS